MIVLEILAIFLLYIAGFFIIGSPGLVTESLGKVVSTILYICAALAAPIIYLLLLVLIVMYIRSEPYGYSDLKLGIVFTGLYSAVMGTFIGLTNNPIRSATSDYLECFFSEMLENFPIISAIGFIVFLPLSIPLLFIYFIVYGYICYVSSELIDRLYKSRKDGDGDGDEDSEATKIQESIAAKIRRAPMPFISDDIVYKTHPVFVSNPLGSRFTNYMITRDEVKIDKSFFGIRYGSRPSVAINNITRTHATGTLWGNIVFAEGSVEPVIWEAVFLPESKLHKIRELISTQVERKKSLD